MIDSIEFPIVAIDYVFVCGLCLLNQDDSNSNNCPTVSLWHCVGGEMQAASSGPEPALIP